jgi:hypothetical protein
MLCRLARCAVCTFRCATHRGSYDSYGRRKTMDHASITARVLTDSCPSQPYVKCNRARSTETSAWVRLSVIGRNVS